MILDRLPNLKQIRGVKYRSTKQTTNDREMVDIPELIDQNQYYDGINHNQPFVFSSINGIGSDDDPFIVCFTALNWMNWFKVDDHHNIFHSDRTHKVILNRFPVLVFGRSDIAGHLHPIAIAILSREIKNLFVFSIDN